MTASIYDRLCKRSPVLQFAGFAGDLSWAVAHLGAVAEARPQEDLLFEILALGLCVDGQMVQGWHQVPVRFVYSLLKQLGSEELLSLNLFAVGQTVRGWY